MTGPVAGGIALGVLLAAVQCGLSILSLRLAKNKSFFMWVWAGGVVFRLIFLVVAGVCVHLFTALSVAATLVTLVLLSTLLLVAEPYFCSKG